MGIKTKIENCKQQKISASTKNFIIDKYQKHNKFHFYIIPFYSVEQLGRIPAAQAMDSASSNNNEVGMWDIMMDVVDRRGFMSHNTEGGQREGWEELQAKEYKNVIVSTSFFSQSTPIGTSAFSDWVVLGESDVTHIQVV